MKRLILCSDGTWNRPGITDNGKPVKSNVELIFNCIGKGSENTPQLKFYETGVGSSLYDKIGNIISGINGSGIDEKIKNLYTFLVLNYSPGDEIYFFGFSRGAYTVRSVAGFILNCGILKPDCLHLLDTAYGLYRNRNAYTKPSSDYMAGFRKNYSIENCTPIKFMGVWDTVGSLGIPLNFYNKYNKAKYKFHDVKLGSHIQYAYHAVAVDERRKSFQPTLWELTQEGIDSNQKVEQRWFCGVHCNIGGGYSETGLSDLALIWMIEKAIGTGLDISAPALLNNNYYTFSPRYNGELRNSLRHIYKLLPAGRRLVSTNQRTKTENGKTVTVTTREVIDPTVHERWNDISLKYRPFNLAPFYEL